jgi:DNA-binding transcriptional LysR family regulator
MNLEVRHLRVICTIAETGSLTRAAAALQQTQPGLSAQLRRIEAMLGGRLFERRASGVAPTALGELVLTHARAVLPTMDELMDAATLAARSRATSRRFRLGSINAPLLGGLIAAVRALHPEADITSRSQGSPLPLVDDVAAGRLEAAVVGDSPGYELSPRPGIVLCPVVTEPVFALLPAAHPLAARDEVDLAALAGEVWAAPRPDNDRTREYWARVVLGTGRQVRIPYEAEGRLLVEIVRNGHAVSLCQPTFDEVPGVAIRPIAGNPLWYRHVLVWHRDGPLAKAGDIIGKRVTEAYEAACARNPTYSRWRSRHGGDRR